MRNLSNTHTAAKTLMIKYIDPVTKESEKLGIVVQLLKSPTLAANAIYYLMSDFKEDRAKEVLYDMKLDSLQTVQQKKFDLENQAQQYSDSEILAKLSMVG